MAMFIVLCLCFLTVNGVFGDEVKSVSVMEGESVTLYTDVVKQRDDLMVWYYGPENTFVARINGKANRTKFSDDERFRDRVNLNLQTGDLNIRDSKTEHSGVYTLQIRINYKVVDWKFNVIVYARLPIPVISTNSSQSSSSSSSSSSNCSLLCLVLNVSDVSLSWYKGNSLLSIISVSDLNIINISLPLEVEYQDTNTYRCVVSNPVSNQTQHLNINHLCQTCSDFPLWLVIVGLPICVLMILVIIYVCRKDRAALLMKTLKAKTNAKDVESSINSSRTSENGEASRFLNGQQKSYIHEGLKL